MSRIQVRQKYEWLWDGEEYFRAPLKSQYVVERLTDNCPEPEVLGEVWRGLAGMWHCDVPELAGLQWSTHRAVVKELDNMF